jgi:membrane-bound lytic murein transglycosylase D
MNMWSVVNRMYWAVLSLVVVFANQVIGAEKEDGIESDSLTLFQYDYSYEYVPDASYDEIEQRLLQIDSEMPLNFNTRVKAFVDYFSVKDREYSKMVMGRSRYYFPIFEDILAKYEMPDELKYLSIVESGLAPRARSRAAAVGLWQFIYSTGRSYGLHVDWYIDERMDTYKATEAACKHLRNLYGEFHDWELALAAYNCGSGNVRKAIRRSGYKKTFWEIYRYLPRETRGYLPQFVALIYLFNYQEEHNFYLEEAEYMYPIAFDTIHIKNYMDFQSLGEHLNVCPEELEMLNPAIKHNALPQLKKSYPIRIPSDKMQLLADSRTEILDSVAVTGKARIDYLARNSAGSTWGREKVVYRVRSGDVLGTIAGKFHVRVSDIKKWNNLHSNLIRVGQRLNIYLKPTMAANYKNAPTQKTKPVVAEINGSKYHIVQPGDTLWSISRAYDNLSIEKIKKINNLSNSKIKPGQKLLIG